ncbi:MAG: NAD(P)-dependent oxidoreductase [Anaerolineales bacterium]|nr:NAD(P)-dependent oxidoreductase [Anaerolineales bacterium]
MPSDTQRVFLTGASGGMGRAGLEALLAGPERREVVALVPPTENDQRIMAPYLRRGVRVIWGDLTHYADVLAGVSGADYVLHVGGLVSPLADAQPKRTLEVNVGAARNIVRAIQAQPEPERVRLVYIGTIAQTGHRPAPIHWGRVGDPIKLSTFDTYALSKTIAERLIVDSGLRHWVSLRQTGIARMAASTRLDPILFHTPLADVLEWVTPRDSGRLLANVCAPTVPPDFWGRIYNIGGGQPNRLTNVELFERTLRATGLRHPRRALDPRWFALRNFHGHWFSDSDRLEALVPFRTQTLDEYLAEQAPLVPWYIRLGSAFPQLVRRRLERVARGPGGTLHWLAHGDEARIAAYFGSREAWGAIRGWEAWEAVRPTSTPSQLDHGYDEQLPREAISLTDVQAAARFRGGQCLSTDMPRGDWRALLRWQCHAGHEFTASLNLILMGGHWCPTCLADPASYPQLAQHSAFFRQVWRPAPDRP